MLRAIPIILMALQIFLARVESVNADLVIVRNSTPNAVVVLPVQPTDEESLAGERLSFYVQKITDVALEVVHEPDLAGRTEPKGRIYVGNTQASSQILKDLTDRKAPPESSLVVSDGNNVFITGVDPIGTLHATYFLLEDFGCRWYLPAEWGIVIPQASELTVTDQRTYRQPSFKMRSGLMHATTQMDTDSSWAYCEWGRGNHLGGWRWWGAGHSYRFLIPKENFEKHPEWFALVDGKRVADQLCISNPEGRAFALETVKKGLAAYGDNPPEIISISPDDTRATLFCQCEDCQRFVQVRPDGTKDFSEGHDRMVAYGNFFAEALRDEYPELLVQYYVDYHSYGFPTLVKPASNSVFHVTHWRGDQFHGQSDDSEMGKAMTNWGKFGLPLLAHPYWGSHTSWGFWPVVHAIKNDVPYYHSKGVVGIYSETHLNWGPQHLNFIVFPRVLWDVTTDVDAFIAEFCDKFYGPAAAPMLRYYTIMEQAAVDGPPQFKYRQTLIPTFTPAVLEQMHTCIEEAESAIQGHDKVYRQRMDFAKAGFELGYLYYSAEHLMRTYPEAKDPAIPQRVTEMLRRSVAIIDDPRFKDQSGVQATHLVESTPVDLVADLRNLLAQHEQGTTFAAGEFKYFEDYYLGGRTFIDVKAREGFINDQYGLSLNANDSGILVYRFDARDGVFETVTGSLVLSNPVAEVPLKIAVQSQPGQPWTPVKVSGSSVHVDFDLTSAASGQSSIWLKIELKNPTAANMHVLHQLHLSGEVRGEQK